MEDYIDLVGYGDSTIVHFAGTVTLDLGQPGESSWDFSDVTSQHPGTMYAVDPASTPFFSLYPDATACAKVIEEFKDLSYIYGYESYSGNTASVYGETIQGSKNEFHILYDPAVSVNFPLTYQDTWSYNGEETFIFDGDESSNSFLADYEIDAYGPLILPGGKEVQALRCLTAETRDFNGTIDVTNMIYFYTNEGDGIEIFISPGSDYNGEVSVSEFIYQINPNPVDVDDSVVPKIFSIKQNYPNPFNPNTNIEFAIPNSDWVKLKVYDANGQEVALLVDEYRHSGTYIESFSPDNLSSGVYFAVFSSGQFLKSIKMTYLK